MNLDTHAARQRNAEELVALANQRSRYKMALLITLQHFAVPLDTQEELLACVTDCEFPSYTRILRTL